MKILDFGSLNLDYVFQVDSIVLPGQTILSNRMTLSTGGKGFNQAVAAARAGAAVFFAGALALKDLPVFQKTLDECGADWSLLDTGHEFTGSAMIQVDRDGQNCIVLYGGANQEITRDFICKVLSGFENGDVLLLQNEISELPFLMKQASERGMRIFLNPSPISRQLFECPMEAVDTLLLNEIEGLQISGAKQLDEIPDLLLKKYPEVKIVLTLGKQGVVYADKNRRLSHGIYDMPIEDTTAAGDTFTGFYLADILKNNDAAHALRIASAASSLAVSRRGAAVSIPSGKEVEAFLRELEKTKS
ncbi:PfkB family carbohydrate kinase [Caproicibacter sp.]|uniref:PfkB family carbohydrate kinase n=1 Tax=Caproicibacter sp. TaxID=2814884 RepID=UPI0039897A61